MATANGTCWRMYRCEITSAVICSTAIQKMSDTKTTHQVGTVCAGKGNKESQKGQKSFRWRARCKWKRIANSWTHYSCIVVLRIIFIFACRNGYQHMDTNELTHNVIRIGFWKCHKMLIQWKISSWKRLIWNRKRLLKMNCSECET